MKPMTSKEFEHAISQLRIFGRSLKAARLVLVDGIAPVRAAKAQGISASAVRRSLGRICPDWHNRLNRLTQAEFDRRVAHTRHHGQALEAARRVMVNGEEKKAVLEEMRLTDRPVQRIIKQLSDLV